MKMVLKRDKFILLPDSDEEKKEKHKLSTIMEESYSDEHVPKVV